MKSSNRSDYRLAAEYESEANENSTRFSWMCMCTSWWVMAGSDVTYPTGLGVRNFSPLKGLPCMEAGSRLRTLYVTTTDLPRSSKVKLAFTGLNVTGMSALT